MRHWSFRSAALLLALSSAQGAPGTRLIYRVRVIESAGGLPLAIADGSVSGPLDTDLRFALRTDSSEIEALFQVVPDGDTVNLSGEFFTKRRTGRSRRGLTLWEQDTYRRGARLAWGDTVRVDLSGPLGRGTERPLWVEMALERGFAGGEGRPGEEVRRLVPGTADVRLEAVVRPRRARIVLNLVRGDVVSGPMGLDMIPEAPARRVQLSLGGRRTQLEIGLARPEPSASARDRVLALDADAVCLRVTTPGILEPVGVLCGRLNNVARRLPLPGGDTLVAVFVWPGGR